MRPAVKVLVLDDELAVRTMLRIALSPPQFEVRLVGNETLALAELTAFHPDVMLLDLHLRTASGLDVCQKIRSHPDADIARTHIILITGQVDEQQRAACIAAGVDRLLRKPFNIAELRAQLSQLPPFTAC